MVRNSMKLFYNLQFYFKFFAFVDKRTYVVIKNTEIN